ncbi:MAG: PfkB family carbohydrate kinase [Anaerolineae bacterium]
MQTPDYVIVGHVTRDLVPGGFRVGGTATYAAMTARALGYRVGVLTSAGPDLPPADLFAGMDVVVVPADESTTFENIYHAGRRAQYVRATAAPLTAADLPEAWRRAPIVHLGPLVQEVDPALARAFTNATFIGVTPQGWLRRWDETGRVGIAVWTSAPQVLARADAMVLSREDVGNDEAQLAHYLTLARLAAVTQSWQGATLYHDGTETSFAAYDVPEVDPTGAGDVFAAAFFIRLRETGQAAEAARFANAAASFAVEGLGYSTIAGRAAVEERLHSGSFRSRSGTG